MITLEAYWMGRDVEYVSELTEVIRGNAQITVDRINELLTRAERPSINRLNSGWRPRSVNETVSNAGTNSNHITGKAGDTPDDDRYLAIWCISNKSALVEIGLWLEHPAWCYRVDPKTGKISKWLHGQTVPPKSGRRIYRPNNDPPYDKEFFAEFGELAEIM